MRFIDRIRLTTREIRRRRRLPSHETFFELRQQPSYNCNHIDSVIIEVKAMKARLDVIIAEMEVTRDNSERIRTWGEEQQEQMERIFKKLHDIEVYEAKDQYETYSLFLAAERERLAKEKKEANKKIKENK